MRTVVVVMVLIAIGIAFDKGWWEIPRHWAPWQPLSVDDPLTLVTKWKLHRLAGDRQGCLAVLERIPDDGLIYTPLDDYTPDAGCPLSNVVRVQSSGVSFNGSVVVSCPLALAWVIYERQRLQPAAEAILGSRVVGIEHYGSYSCRNVYGSESGRLSEHATAEALDVAAFQLADGQRAELLSDWDAENAVGEFLREVRDGACDIFGNVLGPDYNAAHADHFHFGMRGFRLCR